MAACWAACTNVIIITRERGFAFTAEKHFATSSRFNQSFFREMSTEAAVTIRTKKFLTNPLMNRKQCTVEVLHPGLASVSKKDIREKLAKMFKVSEMDAVVPYGFKVAFGGGRSTGFALIYNSVADAKKLDKPTRLIRLGVLEKVTKKGRKGIKEAKNRGKKVRGLGRRIARKKAKRAAE
jgi:small subunit ribosomal protein S24e